MKNSLKLKTITSLLIILMIVAIANISRAYSVDADLSSSGKLKGGQEVKVTLSFKAIDALDGLRSGTIDQIVYDKNIFEEITDDSFDGQNKWSTAYSNGKLVITKSNPMTSNAAVATLTLKVKEGVTAESTKVEFKGIVVASGSVATGGTGNIAVTDQQVTIYADKEGTSGTEDPKTNTLAGTNETNTSKTNTAAKSNTSTNKITSSKTTSSKLPKAGDAATIAIMAIIAIALLAGVVGYIKYSKNKDIK